MTDFHWGMTMFRTMNWKGMKIAGLVLSLTLLGNIAWAGDGYDRGDEAGRAGYQNGYRDGVEHGRFDRNQHYHYNIHSQLYNDARDGYSPAVGPYGYFKKGYRTGYAQGYEEGYRERGGQYGSRWR